MSFTRGSNPIWYFVNLQGRQLDDSYYLFVLQNTFHYLPATVYHDNKGTIPWNSPIQFLSNGTLPEDIFYIPGGTYRLEVRDGPLQSDNIIYAVNNYIPSPAGSSTGDSALNTDNQISNPQFAFVNFSPTFTTTLAGTYQIAPGWKLELVGSGTITVTQVVIAGNLNYPSNPPYVLNINANGWTTVKLIQEFDRVSAIWASESISFSLTGSSGSVGNLPITVNYHPSSSSNADPLIASGTLIAGTYGTIFGGVNLDPSDNSDSGEDAFVQIIINLPASGIVNVTNVQLIAGDNLVNPDEPVQIPYQQETLERQEDYLFHVYSDQLITMPKQSLLVGWNFALNPWQFITKTVTTIAPLSSYIADQTILHQESASSLMVGQGDATTNYGLYLKAINTKTNNRFAIIQYIDTATIAQSWGQILSSLVRSRIFTTHSTQVGLKVRLIYRSDAPPTLSDIEPITGWDANGDVTFAAGWTVLNPSCDPAYRLQNAYETDNGATMLPGMAYDQFSLPASPSATAFLGIVVYTTTAMNQTLSTEDAISFERISLVPNKFAVDAAPETFEQSLRKCQFYYEKSWQLSDLPGTVTNVGSKLVTGEVFQSNVVPTSISPFAFNLEYIQTKRAIPTVAFQSTVTGTVNTIALGLWSGNSYLNQFNPTATGSWTANFKSVDRMCMLGDSSATQGPVNASKGDYTIIQYHYTADARLGI